MKCSIFFILIFFPQLARTLQAIILIYKQQNLPPPPEWKNKWPLSTIGLCQQNTQLQLQETQHRLLQILNTGNQRMKRKCMSMVWIICSKMCGAIGKWTELACGCTDLSFPGKWNWNQIEWRKQVVLQADSRLSSSISSLMEHCLPFEPTPGGAGTQWMDPMCRPLLRAGNAYLQVRQIRGRKLQPQPPTAIPASPPLPAPHCAEPQAPRFSHYTWLHCHKCSQGQGTTPLKPTHIPQTLEQQAWRSVTGTKSPSGGVSCCQQSHWLWEVQEIPALEGPVPRLGQKGALGTHHWTYGVTFQHGNISHVLCQPSHSTAYLYKLVSVPPFCKGRGGGGESEAHCHILEEKSFIINN